MAVVPALVRALSEGHWLGARGRPLSVPEAARCHGLLANEVVWPDARTTCFALLGNTMSAAVLDRIIVRLLAPFVTWQLRDLWETGAEQEALRTEARLGLTTPPRALEAFGFVSGSAVGGGV